MMTAERCRGCESGGAVSLFVVLMVPACAFAAVVAMAVPQRLAAESSLDGAAENLAVLAAASRSASGPSQGPIDPFFPDCLSTAPDPQTSSQVQPLDDAGAVELVADLQQLCEALTTVLLEDLGRLGFDGASLRGFYSGSYAGADSAPDGWTLPCHVGGRVVVADAVHVGMVADWNQAGWAAAQVWPSGLPMGSEAIGRVALTGPGAPPDDAGLHECGTRLDLLTADGRPAWRAGRSDARELAESVPTRFAFGG